ncbi:MAG: hypothetical protein ABJA67_14385 [Chthonomonadales bacterium]
MQNEVENNLAKLSAAYDAGETIDLDKWSKEFPESATEIIAYAQYRFETSGPDLVEEQATKWDRMFLSRAAAVQSRMQSAPETAPLDSLISAAKRVGLTPASLAEKLKIGILMLQRLERRLIEPTGIPGELKSAIADVIDSTPAAIERFLSAQPRLAANANYRSQTAPAVKAQQSFEEAITASEDMSPEQKAYWIEASRKSGE